MRVVKIQHSGMLMTSRLDAGRTNYGLANDDVVVSELDDKTGEWIWN